MPTYCDLCPQHAVMSYATPSAVILLCQHHDNEHKPALAAQFPSYPVAGTPLYVPAGWEACGYGLPVNGPDRHHYPA